MVKPSNWVMKVKKASHSLPQANLLGDLIEPRLGSGNLHHNLLDLENSFSFSNESSPYESELHSFLDVLSSELTPVLPDFHNNRVEHEDFLGFNESGTIDNKLLEDWTGIVQQSNLIDSALTLENSMSFYQDDENDVIDVVTVEETVNQEEAGLPPFDPQPPNQHPPSLPHHHEDPGLQEEESYDYGDVHNFPIPSPLSTEMNQAIQDEGNHYGYYNNDADDVVVEEEEDVEDFYPPFDEVRSEVIQNSKVKSKKRNFPQSHVGPLSDDDSDEDGDNDDDDENDDEDDDDYKHNSSYTKKKRRRKFLKRTTSKKGKKNIKRHSDLDDYGDDNNNSSGSGGSYMSKRKREQNKRAATKYRNKKKMEELENVERLEKLLDRNRELKDIVKSREHEVNVMKRLLMDVLNKKK
ncbi:hypothetical protein HELRODRAFT_178380 [Helobdella robusta]|uniref:BZIP domain-containing protein n=1 Tax=Helobdella robusta TaxID=6412 RepID=T1FD42_HELRO|nr:hypothetical protein HELRODRAFT_178380 [Helobdella robusta]ESN97257.1 hypothetical protein HELRODRAFT_178380 [Helobdella robusta]